MSKTVKIVLATIISVVVGSGVIFAGVCFAPSVQSALEPAFAAKEFAIGFFVGMCLGFFLFIWYPIAKIINWLKTRKLRNDNLEMDLKIKEKQLEQINKGLPVTDFVNTPQTR